MVKFITLYRETELLAIDCKSVVTNEGERLARVSIVNFYGNIVFDTVVKPVDSHTSKYIIVDSRYNDNRLLPQDFMHAPSFFNIEYILQKIVSEKKLIGFGISYYLPLLKLDPSLHNYEVKDLAKVDALHHEKSRLGVNDNNLELVVAKKSLPELAKECLNVSPDYLQSSTIISARLALALYRQFYNLIEFQPDFEPCN